ncbi:consortin [Chanos chanos]|uniref:Consortin n=1 Tax=Chanos chanos TaxID=29144 RepID=A0A6J2WJK5_CHACN|nr:consortin [Chanos chanos]
MDEGQWQSEEPVRRRQGSGGGESDLHNNLEPGRGPVSSGSDQNQNRLVEEGEEVDAGPLGGQQLLQQDTVNNNGDDDDADEDEGSKVEEDDEEDEEEEEEEPDSNSGAFSPDLDIPIRESPSSSPSPTVTEGPMSPEGRPDGASPQPRGLSPALTAALQQLGERCDHALFPQYLHQIAEAFVLEEDYERAVKFIQLERLYHERLLSNLAALQEQWEDRWRLAGRFQDSWTESPHSDLNPHHLDKLSHICSTHKQPAVRLDKCELVDKVQKNDLMKENMASLSTQELSGSTGIGTAETLRPMEELTSSQEVSPPRETSTQPEQRSTTTTSQQREPTDLQDPCLSSLLVPPTSGLTDSSPSRSSEDVSGAEERTCAAATHTDSAAAAATAASPADLPTEVASQSGEGQERQGQSETPERSVQMEKGKEAVDTGQDGGTGKSRVLEIRPEEAVVATGPQEKEDEEVEEAEEALEDGDVEVTSEESLECEPGEDGQGAEPVELAKTDTLDDLAKRIQVEEITPAAGLVSILKRRASLEGANSSTPKPVSKRRVRFREPEDTLDQDEVGGDSWLLLLLLCLATVVISVGGTALYCTIGDAQSSVCTDFSHNVDFYVGQVQRGVDELKHWFSPSS